MTTWFLETFWPAGAIGSAAFILLLMGNRRVDKTLLRAGAVAAAVAATLAVVSWAVQTNHEQVLRRTREVVEAVERHDWPALTALLDEKASLGFWSGRETLVRGAQAYTEQFALRHAYFTQGPEAHSEGSEFISSFTLLSEHDAARSFVPAVRSAWQLQWGRSPEGWRVVDIRPMQIESMERGEIERRYFSNKP